MTMTIVQSERFLTNQNRREAAAAGNSRQRRRILPKLMSPLLSTTTAAATVTTKSIIPVVMLALMVASSSLIQTVDANMGSQCTSCYRGAEMSSSAPQPLCTELKSKLSGLFDTDTDCKDLQLLNYQKGCCLNPPVGYCSFCDDPNIEWDPDGVVDTGQFPDPYNCFEYAVQNEAHLAMFEDGTCDDTFMRRAGYHCGCDPETQYQQCWLCPDRQPPSKPEKSDAWITQSKCRGIEFLFSLLKEEECTALPFNIGADLSIYCGCGGLNQTEIDEQREIYQCSLCENDGGYVTNPDFVYTTDPFPKTCRQAEDFARDIIKTPTGCRDSRYFGTARERCHCFGAADDDEQHSGGGVSITTTTFITTMMTSIITGTAALFFVVTAGILL